MKVDGMRGEKRDGLAIVKNERTRWSLLHIQREVGLEE